MLQIISGKFFESENIFHNECKGILYSNISLYKKETFEHIDLFPVDISNNISSYVVSYDLQLERQSESLSITKTGEDEIIRDLKNILSFGLDCVFDEDKSLVEKVCRIKGSGNGHRAVPSDFINGTLNLNKDSSDNEIDKCKKLFKHIIGLPREDYVNILNCLVAYNASIRLLNEDINLAYSMLVYCLESLSQNYDFYEPKWEDYNQDKKNKLEKIFKSLSLEDSEAIIAILIKDEHFKLSRRFNDFAVKYLDNNYYERNDERIIINKDDVEIALSNAYNIRSKYAHMLKPIMRQLTMDKFSKEGDTFKFCHNTFFTYSGLLRTVRTVVYNFIFSLQTVVLEKFDWSKDLPGIINVELAPYFWLYRDVKDNGESAEHILEGLLKCLIYHRNNIPNMEKTIKVYFEHIPEMKKKNKHAAYVLGYIYTKIMEDITEENKNIFNNYINKYQELIDECCIYNLILLTVVGGVGREIKWELEDCEKIIRDYNRQKHRADRLRLPSEIETMIYLCIAYSNDENHVEKRNEWLWKAYYNSNNIKDIQNKIKESIDNGSVYGISFIWDNIISRYKV